MIRSSLSPAVAWRTYAIRAGGTVRAGLGLRVTGDNVVGDTTGAGGGVGAGTGVAGATTVGVLGIVTSIPGRDRPGLRAAFVRDRMFR